jgi:hypothetical protein
VRALLSPCACGSLQPDLHPEDIVVVDQLVDRTWGRPDSFHLDGPVHHVAFADPYDAGLRRTLVTAGRGLGFTVHDGGVLVVIQGRASPPGPSRPGSGPGLGVVNMTGYPEAVLAAELQLPFAAIALVTDYDAGIDGAEPVSQDACSPSSSATWTGSTPCGASHPHSDGASSAPTRKLGNPSPGAAAGDHCGGRDASGGGGPAGPARARTVGAPEAAGVARRSGR